MSSDSATWKVAALESCIARGAIFWILMIAMSPIAGRLGDRIGILRVAGLGFLILGLFPDFCDLRISVNGTEKPVYVYPAPTLSKGDVILR